MARTAWGLDTPRHDEITRAACRDHDPDMWAIDTQRRADENREAMRICRRECPVRAWCFDEAVRMGTAADGMIYGGHRFPLPSPRVIDAGAAYGLSAAANALGVSRTRLRALLERGALPGYRVGYQWRVRVADVDAYLRGRDG